MLVHMCVSSDNKIIITLVLLIIFSYKKYVIKTTLLNIQLNMTSINNFDYQFIHLSHPTQKCFQNYFTGIENLTISIQIVF